MRFRKVVTSLVTLSLALSLVPSAAFATDEEVDASDGPGWVQQQVATCKAALDGLTQAHAAKESIEQEVEQLRSQLAEKDEAIAAAQQAADEAKEQAEIAQAALDEAQDAATAAEEELAANQEAVAASEEKIATLEADLEAGTTAEEQAVTDAEKALDEANEAATAAQEALDTLTQQQDEGSFAFFESVGATDAIEALESATYADLTKKGETDDATSLANMKASIQWMRKLNAIRADLGLSELKVTDVMMAYAQSDANYSDTQTGHARQFNVGENLAWNYGSDPFKQWYDEEKAYFDQAYIALGGEGDAPVGADAEAWYAEHTDEVEAYLAENHGGKSVGHYLNDIRSRYAVTGFAICSRGTMYGWKTYAQVFYYSAAGDAYTVDEYEERLSAYADKLEADIAEAQGIVDDATEAVEAAEKALTDAQAALADRQDELEADAQELEAEREVLEGLQAKQEELQAAAEEASAALGEAAAAAEEAKAASDEADAAVVALQEAADYKALKSDLATAEANTQRAEEAVSAAQAAYDAELATLNDATSLANADAVTVTVDEDSYDKAYDGKEKEPTVAVTVTLPDESVVKLEQGSDYIVAYRDNVEPASGKGIVVLTGTGEKDTGSWWGTREVTFPIQIRTGQWRRESGGSRWWYRWSDGSYPRSQFLAIGGKTYYFNDAGWMVTGWQKVDGSWYYFKSSGEMVKSAWQKVGSSWYAFDDEGQMRTGWFVDGSSTYFLKDSGAMATGWQKIDGAWYWFRPSGAMVTGWLKVSGSWYWLDPGTGRMRTGWLSISGTFYYLKDSGAMATGWQKINDKWYYFGSSGAMATSKWVQTWYYVGKDGVMVEDGVVDGYTIANGKWDGKGRAAA